METQKVDVKEVVKVIDKAEIWRAEGRCTTCGKPVFRPKEGQVGSTCYEHRGKLRQYSTQANQPPEGWIRMSKVCDAAELAGLTRRDVVLAAGGDAATKPVLDPIFLVCYVGRGKWMDPRVLTTGFELIRKAASAPKTENVEVKPNSTANALKEAVGSKESQPKKAVKK